MSSISNQPFWNRPDTNLSRGFQEVWYLKFNIPNTQSALWLRFTLLSSSNQFRQVAELWGIYFDHQNGATSKLALKQTFAMSAASFDPPVIKIGQSTLSNQATDGVIQSRGKSIAWSLKTTQRSVASCNLVPKPLSQLKLVKNTVESVYEDLLFSGWIEIDGNRIEIDKALGMQAHLAGPKNGHNWVWAHCNSFTDEKNHLKDFVFEGLAARARLPGGLPTPTITSLYFWYQGKPYFFSTPTDWFRCHQKLKPNCWEIQAERGKLRFQGTIEFELRDFAGVTYEDTDGSLLYCSNSKLSNARFSVYENGRLIENFVSKRSAALEIVSREKNLYTPLLV